MAARQAPSVGRFEDEPASDPLLDLAPSTCEHAFDELLSAATRALDPRAGQAGERDLGDVRQPVATEEGVGAGPGERADDRRMKRSASGPVGLRDRARIRPGAEEELQEAVDENVE